MTVAIRTVLLLSVVGAVILPASASTAAQSPAHRLPAAADVAAVNTTTYIDPTADVAAGGMDITTVTVSNDDAGKVTFRLQIPSHATLAVDKEVQLAFDVDRNAATGSSAGNEYAIFVEGRENQIGLYRYDPAQRNYELVAGAPVAGRYGSNVQTIEINRSALANISIFDFELYAGPEDFPTVDDFAPNQGKWTYEIKIGTTPPPQPTVTDKVAIRSFTLDPRFPVAGESFTVSVAVARVGQSGRFNGTVYCSTLPGVQKKWFGSVSPGRASCRWDIPADAAGRTIRGFIKVGEGDSPIVERKFTARVRSRLSLLLARGASTDPAQPTAGRRFYYALTVVVQTGSNERRIRTGSVDCKAKISGRFVPTSEERVLRSEGIRCAWDIPFGGSGRTMAGTIVVRSEGATLRHRFTKRVRS